VVLGLANVAEPAELFDREKQLLMGFDVHSQPLRDVVWVALDKPKAYWQFQLFPRFVWENDGRIGPENLAAKILRQNP
jgi:hypothetical protein